MSSPAGYHNLLSWRQFPSGIGQGSVNLTATAMSEVRVNQDKTDLLVDGAMKLFSIETDDLYAALGAQLLGLAEPTRAAGIIAFFSAVRQADRAVNFIEVLRPGLTKGTEWLELIHEELKRDGIHYLTEVSGELRRGLCKHDLLRLSQEINRENLHTLILVVAAVLGIGRGFEPIAATITVLLLKLGLSDFCRQ
jgi:hypothetical protein